MQPVEAIAPEFLPVKLGHKEAAEKGDSFLILIVCSRGFMLVSRKGFKLVCRGDAETAIPFCEQQKIV